MSWLVGLVPENGVFQEEPSDADFVTESRTISEVRQFAHKEPRTPMSAPGGLARRFWGTASANGMPATSSRDQSLPNNTAPHRTLRRAMASASAKMPRRLCLLGLTDLKTGSSETANAPTPPMSAPGGLARRFWGAASANGMPATSSRDQSPPNNVAPHRTLRRAMASASAKMPRRLRLLGLDRLQGWKFRAAVCADTAYVGARRPCTALLGQRVRKWNARNVVAQTFAAY